MKRQSFAAFAVLVGLAGVCACSSSSGSSGAGSGSGSASTPAAPAGYQTVGGSQQGVSLAVPSSWKAVAFPQDSTSKAASTIGLPAADEKSLETDILEPLAKLKALYAFNTPGVIKLSGGEFFGANVNAYCTSSGVSDQGSAALSQIQSEATQQLKTLPATVGASKDLTLGGIPGLEIDYSPVSPAPAIPTVNAVELVTAPSSGEACFAFLTYPGNVPSGLLNEIVTTIKFY
jgi:hypothetical protein